MQSLGGLLPINPIKGLDMPEVEHRLRSEEGRMTAKGTIAVRARGGTFTLRAGLAKGDVSPLWRLYWLAGEFGVLQAELES